jgi:ABC-type polysaccharide/polyol phosphate export permease
MSDAYPTSSTPAPLGALPPLEDPSVRVVAPAKRRIRLRDILRHGQIVRVLAGRDFKVKYKQSLLGPLWLVFQPLALLLAFLVAFRGLGKVATSGIPYVVFTLVGLSAWTFFAASMTIGSSSILTNANFVRFTPCPRSAFPIAGIIASLPALVVTAGAAFVTAAATGSLSVRVVLLPLGLAWLFILTIGAVGIGAALAVRYRDVIQALPFLLSVGVFFAPIGYSLAGLSPFMRRVVEFNPMTGVIEGWRWMFLANYHPALGPIVVSLVMTAAVAVLGWIVFSRREPTMADVI